MPTNIVKTAHDEHLWSKAKKIVKEQYKVSEDSDRFYKLALGVYKKMKGGAPKNIKTNKSIKDTAMGNTSNNGKVLIKSQVKAHTRTSKTGRKISVRAYTDSRTKKDTPAKTSLNKYRALVKNSSSLEEFLRKIDKMNDVPKTVDKQFYKVYRNFYDTQMKKVPASTVAKKPESKNDKPTSQKRYVNPAPWNIKEDMKVRVTTNAKGTAWEFGTVMNIKAGKARINFGTTLNPLWGTNQWTPLTELEIISKPKVKTYKLGDMWSDGFDYDGLLKYASTSLELAPTKTIEKLFESLQDVNYHSIAKPLWQSILLRRTDMNVASKPFSREAAERAKAEIAGKEFKGKLAMDTASKEVKQFFSDRNKSLGIKAKKIRAKLSTAKGTHAENLHSTLKHHTGLETSLGMIDKSINTGDSNMNKNMNMIKYPALSKAIGLNIDGSEKVPGVDLSKYPALEKAQDNLNKSIEFKVSGQKLKDAVDTKIAVCKGELAILEKEYPPVPEETKEAIVTSEDAPVTEVVAPAPKYNVHWKVRSKKREIDELERCSRNINVKLSYELEKYELSQYGL